MIGDHGGVVPFLAKRNHEENLPLLLNQTLKESFHSDTHSNSFLISNNISHIAVTLGPGLAPCLGTYN